MSAVFDTTAFGQIGKARYTKKQLDTIDYADQPWLAMVPKKEDLGGTGFTWALRYGLSTTGGVDVATAQGNGSPSSFARFTIPDTSYANNYQVTQLSGPAIDYAAGNENTLFDLVFGELDGGRMALTRYLGMQLFRNGGGAIGQISAASNTGTPTITLANLSDATNFTVGMTLQVSAADGTSGAVRTGTVIVKAVDPDAGTVTVLTGNWTTGIAAAAANDFIFRNGDFGKAIMGLATYLPTVAPTAGDSVFGAGVDRSVAPRRLAGVRSTAGAGGPIEESLVNACATVSAEGGRPDLCLMNPIDWANLAKFQGSRVVYDRVSAFKSPDIGFRSLRMIGPKTEMDIVQDVNCPRGTAYMLTKDTWCLRSAGRAPKAIDFDDQQWLRQQASDTFEARQVYRAILTCDAPGWNAVVTL